MSRILNCTNDENYESKLFFLIIKLWTKNQQRIHSLQLPLSNMIIFMTWVLIEFTFQ